jgi:hypothetical protein
MPAHTGPGNEDCDVVIVEKGVHQEILGERDVDGLCLVLASTFLEDVRAES